MIYDRYSLRALLAVIALVPIVAAAQKIDRDPLNSPETVKNTPYQSAFADYKNYQEPEFIPWRAANDEVREFGSMAGMEGMEGKENMADKQQRGMSKIRGKTMRPIQEKPVSSDGKPSERGNMQGYDMSKMKGSNNTNKMKAPDRDMKAMGDMKGKEAPVSAPNAMPEHNGMQKQ